MDIQLPIIIVPDDKGYIDRECPKENCLYTFKIKLEDWQEKVSDEEVHCPRCGHIDTSDKWWTQQQLNEIQENATNFALNYAEKEIDKAFRKLEKSTRHNKYLKIKYKPGKRTTFINNPIGQSEEWETEICCPQCGTRYSVIGAAYFCPCCGYNSAINAFNDSMQSFERMLDSLPEIGKLIEEKYSKDQAITMVRSMLENSISEMVSAFQKFASRKYEELTGKSSRVNDFQIISKGNNLFKSSIGFSYTDAITAEELEFMNVIFQKRHLIEHNAGIIDQTYIDRSGDKSYLVGQRLVINIQEAYKLLKIIKQLGNAISQLT